MINVGKMIKNGTLENGAMEGDKEHSNSSIDQVCCFLGHLMELEDLHHENDSSIFGPIRN